MSFNTAFLSEYLAHHRCGVAAMMAEDGAPRAARIQFVVNDRLELFFDGYDCPHLLMNVDKEPRIALVVGGCTPGDESCLQYDGVVTRPAAEESESLQQAYFAAIPAGRRRAGAASQTYLLIRPRRLQYIDRNVVPTKFVVFDGGGSGRALNVA
ncbi:MAG TPA: hypothetical protein VJQ47_13190 [Steroidobacteraceae bacterium]|nr:hypothetical protein [Steroidobacteraceae bacterium]